MKSPTEKSRITDHLANERTFLAWIRTSIALMGFGFVIVKFAVFIRQVSIILADKGPVVPRLYSAEIGVGMVVFGAVVAGIGYFNFIKTQRVIEGRGEVMNNTKNLIITLIIIAVSALLIGFLIPNIRF